MDDFRSLPPDLPRPQDDGAADHLLGAPIAEVKLRGVLGDEVDLAAAAREILVLFVYPRTGTPGQPTPEGWDEIPGARGCTVQNIAYRDRYKEMVSLGAEVVGLSAQPLPEVREFAVRERIPFPLLTDSEHRMAAAMRLPTFEVDGMRLYKRLTLIAREGQVTELIYPVFPPGSDAQQVVDLLRAA